MSYLPGAGSSDDLSTSSSSSTSDRSRSFRFRTFESISPTTLTTITQTRRIPTTRRFTIVFLIVDPSTRFVPFPSLPLRDASSFSSSSFLHWARLVSIFPYSSSLSRVSLSFLNSQNSDDISAPGKKLAASDDDDGKHVPGYHHRDGRHSGKHHGKHGKHSKRRHDTEVVYSHGRHGVSRAFLVFLLPFFSRPRSSSS